MGQACAMEGVIEAERGGARGNAATPKAARDAPADFVMRAQRVGGVWEVLDADIAREICAIENRHATIAFRAMCCDVAVELGFGGCAVDCPSKILHYIRISVQHTEIVQITCLEWAECQSHPAAPQSRPKPITAPLISAE